jgi:hypothetical protein
MGRASVNRNRAVNAHEKDLLAFLRRPKGSSLVATIVAARAERRAEDGSLECPVQCAIFIVEAQLERAGRIFVTRFYRPLTAS